MNYEIAVATYPFIGAFEQSLHQMIGVAASRTVNSINYDWGLVENAKLIIFTGGADINPAIYNQPNQHSLFNEDRDTAELAVLDVALGLHKKILGVCRGHQLVNAFLGGELVQDIGIQLNQQHSGYHILLPTYDKSDIFPLFPNGVNSIHHQGVVKVGKGLTPTTYYNGVYESCESDTILTTQFHPEFMGNDDSKNFFRFVSEWANLTVKF